VSPVPAGAGSTALTVSPGYAISPYGDEIVVSDPVSRVQTFVADPSIVAIRYDERLVDPVPVSSDIPGSDTVQFSAVEETYAVEVFQTQGPDDRWVILAAVASGEDGDAFIDVTRRQHARRCH
jgi:hypothetical protein